MAFGDTGGPVTELIITCHAKTPIKNGDALWLCGEYSVASGPLSDKETIDGYPIFGQAMSHASIGEPIPVRVRGVCIFRFSVVGDTVPIVDVDRGGYAGVCLCDTPGEVASEFAMGIPRGNFNNNIILKTDRDNHEVWVLL